MFNERNSSITRYDRKHFVDYLNILANAKGLSLRAIERCITRLRIVMDQTPSDQYLDSVLLALLIVLYTNEREYFNQIVNGQVSPEDVIKDLTSLSGGKLPQKEINVLYAYLSVADPDKGRAEERIKELRTKQSKDHEAYQLLLIMNKICGNDRYNISLDKIAKKIDLVSWIN